jgi:hypothetical protein
VNDKIYELGCCTLAGHSDTPCGLVGEVRQAAAAGVSKTLGIAAVR